MADFVHRDPCMPFKYTHPDSSDQLHHAVPLTASWSSCKVC